MEFITADTRGPYGRRRGRGLLAGRQDGGVSVRRQHGTALGRGDGRRPADARGP